MNEIDTWGTNIFDIGDSTNHRPLTAVTFTILVVSFKNYATDRDKFRQASQFSNPDRQCDQLGSEINRQEVNSRPGSSVVKTRWAIIRSCLCDLLSPFNL